MVRIIIDGKTYEADDKKNLLENILSFKLNLQYFCWHPAMGSVGACRQCAVKRYRDPEDKTGKLIMACMEPVQEGMIISIEDPEAKEFRAGVIEWLMINHPHDCPVCDEGGECHLQDMTLMSGHNYRRYNFSKRTYRNQNLGPLINHEMNRCIQCYRCVRYYRDYAGGTDFNVFASHDNVYFGRYEDGVLENEFSGNLIEVCPTGVFTDKTLHRHYTRKWDLTSAPSICVHCGVGCNTIAGERYGKLRRILTRYNGEVNGYFLCDRGRFGYEFVNDEKRIRRPAFRQMNSNSFTLSTERFITEQAADVIRNSKRVIGIGSPRAALESNYMLRSLVPEGNFYWGVNAAEFSLVSLQLDILRKAPFRTPSLREIEDCDAAVVLGEDLTNTAPMIALALRQSVRREPVQSATPFKIPHWQDAAVRELVQDEKGPVYIATPASTKLDEIASAVYRAVPRDISKFGMAIASAISSEVPIPEGLPDEIIKLSRSIAEALSRAERPLIVSGPSLGSSDVIKAAANIALAMKRSGKNAEVCFTVPECNSMGMAMMGGKNLNDAIADVEKDGAETLIILENDLFRRAGRQQIMNLLSKFRNVIVLDQLENETTLRADIVFPAGSFAESDGTFVNNEGRAQRYYQVFMPDTEIKESWRWLKDIAVEAGQKKFARLNVLDDFTKALILEMPVFHGIDEITPPTGFRIAGEKIPRAPYRFSGRTAMHADRSVHEQKPPEDVDSPLSFTMEGFRGQQPSSIIPFIWSPGWNSAQAINKYQIEIGGPLHGGDPGKRLIEPAASSRMEYFSAGTDGKTRPQDRWLLVPVYHIFGSDELSRHAEGIAELSPSPYLLMSIADISSLGLTKASYVNVSFEDDHTVRLPVKPDLGLPQGTAGYPVGLKGMDVAGFPGYVKISGADNE